MLEPLLIRAALAETKNAAERHPEAVVLRSIEAQLRYLLDVAEGRADGERLGEIVLGIQTAREVEPLDEVLADKLHDVAEQVRELAHSR